MHLSHTHVLCLSYLLRFENVKVDQKLKKLETERGINRFHLIVGKPFKGNVDALEMDVYKFGSVRTFQEYLDFSGITFEEGKNDTDSCNQLHWMPYSDPKEVETIVGGGWKLYPKTEAPKAIEALRIPDVRAGKDPVVLDEPEDATAQHAVDAHADTGAGGGEQGIINPKFRQEMADKISQGASNGSVGLFLIVVAVLLFVMISNDGFSRGIRRSFRMKTSASSK